jgi:hypothetical protein
MAIVAPPINKAAVRPIRADLVMISSRPICPTERTTHWHCPFQRLALARFVTAELAAFLIEIKFGVRRAFVRCGRRGRVGSYVRQAFSAKSLAFDRDRCDGCSDRWRIPRHAVDPAATLDCHGNRSRGWKPMNSESATARCLRMRVFKCGWFRRQGRRKTLQCCATRIRE